MSRHFSPCWLTAAFLTFAVLFPAGAQTTVLSASGAGYGQGLERQTFVLINQYRKANRLPLLQWDGIIAGVARAHSKDMATGEVDFGHEGFSRRVTQLKTAMSDLRGAGENVLKTDDPDQVAERAVALWLRSPHHLENIRGDYNYSGLGIWVDGHGMIYFTQIFVKIQPQAQTAQAAPPPGIVTPFGLLAAPNPRSQP